MKGQALIKSRYSKSTLALMGVSIGLLVSVLVAGCSSNVPRPSQPSGSNLHIYSGDCVTASTVSSDLGEKVAFQSSHRTGGELDCDYRMDSGGKVQMAYVFDPSSASSFRSGLARIVSSKITPLQAGS